MKKKIGDRIRVKDKFFCPFNDLDGTIVDVDKWDKKVFVVKIDDVDKLQHFENKNLKLL